MGQNQSYGLRYLKNHVEHISTLPKAITFDPTIGVSISLVFWKLDIHKFPRTSRSTQSESKKAIKYAIEVRTEKQEKKIANVNRVDSVHLVGPPT